MHSKANELCILLSDLIVSVGCHIFIFFFIFFFNFHSSCISATTCLVINSVLVSLGAA